MNYLVFGANGAVGSLVGRELVSADHQVFLFGRNGEELSELATSLGCRFSVLDACDISAVGDAMVAARSELGPIDGIVNCAGSVLIKPAHLTTADEWHYTIATNLTSSFAVTKFAPEVMAEDGGIVVLFSSAAAEVGLPNHEAIAAAKAGVTGLARSASATYASRKIRFNVVAPGLVKSKMTEPIWSRERSASYSQKMHAVDRLGEPQDIASLVSWLLRPENDWITGAVFNVDGGLARVRSR